MSYGGSGSSGLSVLGLGSPRRQSWVPQHRIQRRRSNSVACLWKGTLRRRSESFSERQTYRPVIWKSLDVSVKTPEGCWRRVIGEQRMQVWELVAPLVAELRLHEPRLYMAESGALVSESACASLLDGEDLVLEEGKVPWDPRSASDMRLGIVKQLLASEEEYCETLKTGCDLYEKPLRKLISLDEEDYRLFFDWVKPLCSLSRMVTVKLKVAIDEWETCQTKVGNIFSKLFWSKYEEYQNMLVASTLPLLKERQTMNVDFVTVCRMSQGAAKHSLESLMLLPLERLSQYERYLSLLAEQTSPDHPDYADVRRTAKKATSMVRRSDPGKDECDLDRIQDLFPSDNLRLHERDPLSPRKGLIRSKSSAASKIQRALPGKTKSPNGELSCSPTRPESSSPQKKHHLWGDDNYRVFIMESPVNFTMGVQNQDRHLFLFNDMILIAKPRSGGIYKLKDKVRMCEIWLSHCIGDVCESLKSPATSFVMGWPTTNVVVTFSSLKAKDLWLQKLQQLVEESKDKEGKTLTSIQISYKNPQTCEELYKTLKVDNRHTVQECIRLLLHQLGQSENTIKDFKLWVKTGKDDAPYPLIGHEYPFSIKMNFIRELLRRSDLDFRNFNNISTDSKCYFILHKNTLNSSIRAADPRTQKKRKKHRRPHHKINWLFRRPGSKHDSVDSGNGSPPPNNLFGQPLWKLCPESTLPKPIMAILAQLFQHGPFTVGIFRKSANARTSRELKEKLEADHSCDMSGVPVIVLASVFKEFLRSLPDCLLQSRLYKQWLQSVSLETEWECKKQVLRLLAQLPPANILLLQYTLCVLWHISKNASENKMSSTNLAVCIGPSLLNPGTFQSPALLQEDVTKKVPKTVSYLIDHCPELLGEHVLRLLGPFPERDSSRQDSGAEESDSLHSLQDLGNHYRRDDSSIDSLDRDFLDEIEPSPKLPCKSKMSLTNLSRDSGLTLSDTQLYTPEEEGESESSSGDGRRGNAIALTKSVPHLETAGLDCGTATYSKNAGVSIDGSCHDVVRKRRQVLETQRTKSTACTSLSYPHTDIHYDSSPHLPLQLSQSYSYSMQQDLMGRTCNRSSRNNEHIMKRRELHSRTCHERPMMSSGEPGEDFGSGTLRRSASEESLLQKYGNTSASKRMLTQRKRRAPSPPSSKLSCTTPTSRKKQSEPAVHKLAQQLSECKLGGSPDRHAIWFAAHSRRADWKRSQSTSKIDEIDQARDSSTLSLVSSEDSTPHISRSNSRVQELGSSKSHSDLYDIYYVPPRVNSVCSSASEGSQQSQASRGSHSSNKSSGSHRSLRSNGSMSGSPCKPVEPPSYIEAINRQTMLRQMQQPTVKQVTEEMRAEQTTLSAKARELYEHSVRMYTQQIPDSQETHHAVPIKIENNGDVTKTISKESNSPQRIIVEGSHSRLRHLPPVHVSDSQLQRTRNFHLRVRQPRDDLPDDLKKEISWSVAQLRSLFTSPQPESNSHYYASHIQLKSDNQIITAGGATQHILHTRSRSLSSRSEEESFV